MSRRDMPPEELHKFVNAVRACLGLGPLYDREKENQELESFNNLGSTYNFPGKMAEDERRSA